jgi:hypothetical protein
MNNPLKAVDPSGLNQDPFCGIVGDDDGGGNDCGGGDIGGGSGGGDQCSGDPCNVSSGPPSDPPTPGPDPCLTMGLCGGVPTIPSPGDPGSGTGNGTTSAPNNGAPKTCIQKSLMATIPGLQDASQTVGAPGPYNGYGHMNEVDTLTFSSPTAQYAFQGSTRLGLIPSSVSELGFGPGVRLGNGLHVEFYGFPNGQFAVTSHLDLFNPNDGLGPLLGLFFVDVLFGHIRGKNSGALDKGC